MFLNRFLPLLAILACQLTLAPVHADVYKYQDKYGKWHFTDKPPKDKAGSAVTTAVATKTVKADLREKLHDRFKPSSKVAEASLSVVTVRTSSGSGSGFFVTADGYLITNRHVVRPSTSSQWKENEEQLSEWKSRLDRYKADLNDDEERLADARRTIDENREYMESGRASDSEKKRYERYIARYDKNRERHEGNVSKYRKLERDYKKRKSDFGFNSSMSNFSKKFTIVLKDGKQLKARLIKISKDFDLALLKLDNYATPFLELAKKRYPRQGSEVFAIGSPLGITDSLTSGIVTKAGKKHLFTDTQILPGNSGGPLINGEGRVLGVNTAVVAQNQNADGLGLAIYSSFIRSEFAQDLAGKL